MKTPKITWKSGLYSTEYGHAGERLLFEVSDDRGYKVRHYIGKGGVLKTHFQDLNQAKAAAVRILQNFLGKIEYEEK